MLRIRVAQGHAAGHGHAVGQGEDLAHHVGVVRQRGLGAGGQAVVEGGEHHVLDEHAEVEPRALVEVAVDEKEQPHRRAEEAVVVVPALLGLPLVLAADAEGAVEGQAAGLAPLAVGAAPLVRVVGVVGIRLPPGLACFDQCGGEPFAGFAFHHGKLPRLGVDPGGGPAGGIEDGANGGVVDAAVEEGAGGAAGAEGLVQFQGEYSLSWHGNGEAAISPNTAAQCNGGNVEPAL